MSKHNYIEGVSCPACYGTRWEKALRADDAKNARSRFADALVCSACGAEEAMRGFFWKEAALARCIPLTKAGQND